MESRRSQTLPWVHCCEEHFPWMRPLTRGGFALRFSADQSTSPPSECAVCARSGRQPLDDALARWEVACDRLDEVLGTTADDCASVFYGSTFLRIQVAVGRVARARAAVWRLLGRWLAPVSTDSCRVGADAPIRCEVPPARPRQEGPPEDIGSDLDLDALERTCTTFCRAVARDDARRPGR